MDERQDDEVPLLPPRRAPQDPRLRTMTEAMLLDIPETHHGRHTVADTRPWRWAAWAVLIVSFVVTAVGAGLM